MNEDYKQGLIELKDKRKLGYAILGEFTGKPILFFHGWPGTRNDISCFHKIAKKMKCRIISLDRPGYSHSDFQKKRSVSDFSEDVLEVLDFFSIEEIPILAFSSGGLYAFETALKLPKKITSLNLVSAIPYFKINIEEEILNPHIKYLRILVRFPGIIRLILRIVSDYGLNRYKRNSEKEYNKSLRLMPEIDNRTWSQKEIKEWFLGDYLPDLLLSKRKGISWDLFLVIWSLFYPESSERSSELKIPVNFWHGLKDKIVPYSTTREQSKLFPEAKVTFYPNEGHKILYTHFNEILDSILSMD
ncbi:MAG TPA: alpha/beta hydrolase [candidate division Zixibacteria bacterium]|nr:alpha/beta hydrolase [candidate division Zixibacteria bacterium]